MDSESSHTNFLAQKFSLNTYAFILIFIMGILSYSNSFYGPFVFDDKHNIVEFEEIHLDSLSVSALSNVVLGGNTTQEVEKRPLGRISFALNYYFGKLDTFGYHVVNLLIHLLTASILYLFMKLTLNFPTLHERYEKFATEISLLASLFFLVHPIQTQAVNYISQRITSLAALFFLLTLYCYGKASLAEGKKQKSFFAISALSALLAFGSKEIAITLPFFVALYEYYFCQGLDLGNAKKKWFYSIISLFLLAALIGLIYTGFDPVLWLNNKYKIRTFTPSQRVLTQFRVVIFYISLLILPLPSRLNLDHHFYLSYSLFNPFTTLVCFCLVIGLIAGSIYLAKKRPLISFALIWFWGNLVLESSFLPLELIFEHRLYLPSVGFFILLSILLVKGVESLNMEFLKKQGVKITSAMLLMVPLSAMSYQRNKVWQDKLTLWEDAAAKSSCKARPNYNLGHIYEEKGQVKQAIAKYQLTVGLDPKFKDIHNSLGNTYFKQKKFKQAIAEYLAEIKHNPDNIKGYYNLANTYRDIGLKKQALSYYNQIFQFSPDSILAYYGLAKFYKKSGDYSQAITNYQKAIEQEPKFALAMSELGEIYQQQQLYPQALQLYKKALRLRPDFKKTYCNLAKIYMQQRNYAQAKILYGQLVQTYPDSVDAHYNLGIVNSILGNHQMAEKQYLIALKLNPDHTLVNYGLAGHYEKLGNHSQAINYYQKTIGLAPNFVPAHKGLGSTYLKISDSAKAILHFEKSLALDPNQANASKLRYLIDQITESKAKNLSSGEA